MKMSPSPAPPSPLLLLLLSVCLLPRCSAFDMSIDEMKVDVELTELDYEDSCATIAEARWAFVQSPSNETLLSWERKVVDYGDARRAKANESYESGGLADPSLTYKYELLGKPGDILMESEHYQRLVSFSGTAELYRKSVAYAKYAKKFAGKDVDHVLSHSGTAEAKRRAWRTWHQQLADGLLGNFTQVLPLLERAAQANGANDVQHYWEMLSVYPDGYQSVKYQWSELSNLHGKVLRFVRRQLALQYAIQPDIDKDGLVPAYLLGYSRDYDWTAIPIDLTLGKNVTLDLRKNLWKEKLIGVSLYKSASLLSKTLLNQTPREKFWKQSRFDGRCPSELINFCRDGNTRVSSCADASISTFLAAHKDVGRVAFSQLSVESTPVLNMMNRYSALEEAVSELLGVLSASPAWLGTRKLMKKSADDDESGERSAINDEDRQIASLLITALDVLPRLAYYVAADAWRIDVLRKNITHPKELISSWWEHRRTYEGIAAGGNLSDDDERDLPTFLNDRHITENKPYLPKYIGVLLAFQLYEHMMKSTEVRYDRVEVKTINADIMKMIRGGAADNWMDVLNKYLAIEDISADALLSFFTPLENFIDELADEEVDYTLDTARQLEIEHLERKVLEELNAPTTTTTTSTAALAPAIRSSTAAATGPTKTTTRHDNGRPETKTSPLAAVTESARSPQDNSPQESLDKLLDSYGMETEVGSKSMVNTSKAVWAVAAVLVATITICVIAIFGRRRCRKTPKNRGYV